MPKLSVIMSVYNGEPYLRDAIDSVLGQTFEAFEFILNNDGSTDRSGDIIEDYACRDQPIVAIHQHNRGLVETLNRGLSLAESSLIARMDSDDVSLPDRFEELSSMTMPAANSESLPQLRCEVSRLLKREGLGRSCGIVLLSAAQVVRNVRHMNSL